MISNYFKLALRNLIKRKGYSLLNILGLAIGITCCLLIFQYVSFERSYDNFPGKAKQIARLRMDSYQQGKLSWQSATVYPAFGPTMKKDFPEVEDFCRLIDCATVLANKNTNVKFKEEKGYFADPSSVSMLGIQMEKGDPSSVLKNSRSIIISETMARKYFGRDDPVGETLELGHAERATVTAVLEDLPSNTHLDVSMIASGSSQASAITSLDRTSMPAFGVKSSHRTRPDSGYLPSAVAIDVETSTGFRQFGHRFPATPRQRPACVGHSPGRNSNWPRAGGSGYLPAGSVCDEPESSVGHKPGARDPPCL